MNKAIIICGPTASGKTGYAHTFAKKYGGEIVNCDSMQVYQQIPIITASPIEQLKQEIPYHLYNCKDIAEEFSVAEYCVLAAKTIREISGKGKLPIIVGGSGMYVNALVEGLNQIPSIDSEIRENARALHIKLGQDEFYQQLIKLDPQAKNVLKPNDAQRAIRAYEVLTQTGKSIFAFQAEENIKPLPEYEFKVITFFPNRKFLYECCDQRLAELFASRAIEEIEKTLSKGEHFGSTAIKALGVSQIISFLRGDITKPQALEIASAKTRQYAKRQTTWFRHQLKSKEIIEFNNFQEYQNILQHI